MCNKEGVILLNDFVISVLNSSTYITAILMIILAGLLCIALPLYLIWTVLNYIYKRTKYLALLAMYIRHRKAFNKWYKETNPDVYTPKLK